jgi:hypothetical protein
MDEWTLDEELLALGYFAEARSRWAAAGLKLGEDLESDERRGHCPMLPDGMTAAEVWLECLQEARSLRETGQ